MGKTANSPPVKPRTRRASSDPADPAVRLRLVFPLCLALLACLADPVVPVVRRFPALLESLVGRVVRVVRVVPHLPSGQAPPAVPSCRTGLVVLADLVLLAFGLRSIGFADAALSVDSEAPPAQREIRPVPLALRVSLAPLQ